MTRDIIIIIIAVRNRTVIEDFIFTHLLKKFPKFLFSVHTSSPHFFVLKEKSGPSLARRFL